MVVHLGGAHGERGAQTLVAVGGQEPLERVRVVMLEAAGDDPRPVAGDEAGERADTRCRSLLGLRRRRHPHRRAGDGVRRNRADGAFGRDLLAHASDRAVAAESRRRAGRARSSIRAIETRRA